MKYSRNIVAEVKKKINAIIYHEIASFFSDNRTLDQFDCNLQKTKDLKFGDYSTNILMKSGINRDLIQSIGKKIINALPKKIFTKAEIVGPGFLNIWLSPEFNKKVINEAIDSGENFGQQKNTKLFYNIEFVSANPTGLLHIGHARNAAIGDTIARIWEKNGIKVNREYYINDGGNQIDKLALSVLIRYKQLFDKKDELPEDSYHGKEIIDVANAIKNEHGDKFLKVKYNKDKITDKKEVVDFFKNFSSTYMLELIKTTLHNFGVDMDIWFHESDLYKKKLIDIALDSLASHTYKKENALWLKTTELGDDKDRVLIKSDGSNTYFTPDIAYHKIKLSRGYDKIFNVWGADHKSYADRMNIAIQLLGYKKEQIEILIMQMVRLVKDGKEFKMSKRTGNSLTLSDLVNAIGKDAARWYLASQTLSTHLEIDIDKAIDKSNNNPIYYVQYAHARICKLLSIAKFKKTKEFDLIKEDIEKQIIDQLNYFVPTIEAISKSCEINKITNYLLNLAKLFHSFYGKCQIINDKNIKLSQQRYWLCVAIKNALASGLKLLDIQAVESM